MSYCQINFRGLRTLGFHLSNYSAMVSVPNFLGSMFSLRFIRGLIIHGFREAKIKLIAKLGLKRINLIKINIDININAHKNYKKKKHQNCFTSAQKPNEKYHQKN